MEPQFECIKTEELWRPHIVINQLLKLKNSVYLMSWSAPFQVTVEEGNVQTLLPAACLLQLAEIQEACCEFLKRQLDPSNCLGIRAFADTHSCRELLRIADKFTQHNFQEVRTHIQLFTVVYNRCIVLRVTMILYVALDWMCKIYI